MWHNHGCRSAWKRAGDSRVQNALLGWCSVKLSQFKSKVKTARCRNATDILQKVQSLGLFFYIFVNWSNRFCSRCRGISKLLFLLRSFSILGALVLLCVFFSVRSYVNASRLLLSERVFPLISSESCCQTCFMLRAAHACRPGYQGEKNTGQKRLMELNTFPDATPPTHTHTRFPHQLR